jgi:hypothetical protein
MNLTIIEFTAICELLLAVLLLRRRYEDASVVPLDENSDEME